MEDIGACPDCRSKRNHPIVKVVVPTIKYNKALQEKLNKLLG